MPHKDPRKRKIYQSRYQTLNLHGDIGQIYFQSYKMASK